MAIQYMSYSRKRAFNVWQKDSLKTRNVQGNIQWLLPLCWVGVKHVTLKKMAPEAHKLFSVVC